MQGLLIEPLYEDVFHRLVFDVVKMQRPPAGCFQTERTVFFLQTDYTLGCAQVVEHAVGEQTSDKLVAVAANQL